MSWTKEDKWAFLDSDFCWPPKPARMKILKDGSKLWLSNKYPELFSNYEGKLVVYDYCDKTPDDYNDILVYTDSNGYKYWNRYSFLKLRTEPKTKVEEITH